ncbi:SHOCT domain-containing protein [Gordonia sp. NPDC003424]
MTTFWVVAVFGIAALFRPGRGREDSRVDRADDQLWILEDRFARGEIDADEFWARRRRLRPPR